LTFTSVYIIMSDMRKYIALLLVLVLVSCSYIPFVKKKSDGPSQADKKTEKVEKKEKVAEGEPKPGDIRVIGGVEYIYARNRRYLLDNVEPEYVWIRKDQYSAGFGENLLTRDRGDKKERDELQQRISKLEEELKKKGIAPQLAYPSQMGYLPTGTGFAPGVVLIPFNYPSPKMRRRVIVLPFVDQTNFKEESLSDLATKRLISRLENTGAILCINPDTINHKGAFTDRETMRVVNELYGIQAVLKGSLSDIFTTTSKVEGKDVPETSFAMSKVAVDVYDTETGGVLKQLFGRNPVSLSRERGDMSTEKAKIKAIDLAIELIADDLLKAVLALDWHARIASVEKEKIYLNVGRMSGLEKGSVLEVYAPGEQIIDSKTKAPLGKVKGAYRGELEVVELFGVDASWAKARKGSTFSPTDLVYFKN
jgi:hypothetical protein